MGSLAEKENYMKEILRKWFGFKQSSTLISGGWVVVDVWIDPKLDEDAVRRISDNQKAYWGL